MVSVVIPTYNAGKYLSEAVHSALVQDVELEVIIVDDASTDGSPEMLFDYLKKIGYVATSCISEDFLCHVSGRVVRVRIITNSKNIGVAQSRNKGVMAAEGEYIAYLDADDIWLKGKLKRQIKLLEKTAAPLCNTARELINQSGESMRITIPTPDIITLRDLERTNYINCSSVLIKREIALKYLMEHSDAHEDYLTWLRILKDYQSVVGINVPLLKYRMLHNSKSGSKLKSAKMTYRTYCYAGYGKLKAMRMMVSYTINGIKKYNSKKL